MNGKFLLVEFIFSIWISNSFGSYVRDSFMKDLLNELEHSDSDEIDSAPSSVSTSTSQNKQYLSFDKNLKNTHAGFHYEARPTTTNSKFGTIQPGSGTTQQLKTADKKKVSTQPSIKPKVEGISRSDWLKNYVARSNRNEKNTQQSVKMDKETSPQENPNESLPITSSSKGKDKIPNNPIQATPKKEFDRTQTTSSSRVALNVPRRSKKIKKKTQLDILRSRLRAERQKIYGGGSFKPKTMILTEPAEASALTGQTNQVPQFQIVYAKDFTDYLHNKSTKWFSPSATQISFIAQNDMRRRAIYLFHEFLGNEILAKLDSKIEQSVKVDLYKQTFDSHATKSLISSIELIDRMFVEPLYDNEEEKLKGQRNAIVFVKEFWSTVKNSDGTNSPIIPEFLPDEEHANFRNNLKKISFNLETEARLCNIVLRWWLKKNFSHLHDLFTPDSRDRWSPWALGLIQDYLLSLEHIGAKIEQELDSNVALRNFLKGKPFLTHKFIKPFKLTCKSPRKLYPALGGLPLLDPQ